MKPPAFVLYSRLYCHLCEQMLGELRELQKRYAFDLVVEDVDDDPELFAQYNERVPVLAFDGGEVCHYHLDRARLLSILELNRAHR